MRKFKINLDMRKNKLFVVIISAVALFGFSGCRGNEYDKENNIQQEAKSKPLNISVFLDLSDRLKNKTSGMMQCEKDTAIVNNIVDLFKDQVLENKIIGSKDCFKVFFYPQPSDSKINALATKMEYDFAKMEINQKKHELGTMKEIINANLGNIYSSTINKDEWPGCNIWGFFNEKVKSFCVKEEYRNILIILTDGYIYHRDSKHVDGTKTSYILPSVLTKANPKLICKTTGLANLEVLMLEIDCNSAHNDKMKEMIGTWLSEMGVSKYEIHSTDLPNNTKILIENFLK